MSEESTGAWIGVARVNARESKGKQKQKKDHDEPSFCGD